jgi:RNA polymerase sigma factor (sigma-70 family)
MPDEQLLERFIAHRDEAAFEALVRRHGPMVLGVCRRVLHDPHDAEDAFQATFLVLVRKAAAIGKRELLANWLYGVAHRTALKARAAAARRRGKEQPMVDPPCTEPGDAAVWRDLRPVLDGELQRLPAKYRAPVVLCYLEGKAYDEAAQQLGWPKGTLSTRLTQARELLRRRLTRRGVTLSAGALATALSPGAASAVVPMPLIASTSKAALALAAGQAAAAGVVSASVAALMEGVLKAMFLTKLKVVALMVLAVSIVGGGAVAYGVVAASQLFGPAADQAKTDPGQQPKSTDPKPSELARKYVDKIVDPSNTLVLVVGQSRLFLFKVTPTRIQLANEQVAGYNMLEPMQLSIVGHQLGTTVLNIWFPDPDDERKQAILSYLVRVVPEAGAGAPGGGLRPDPLVQKVPPDPEVAKARAAILKTMLDAARTERELRVQRFEMGVDPIDGLMEVSRRYVKTLRETNATKAEYIAAHEEYVALMKKIEDAAKARYEAGRIMAQDVAMIQYYHAEARLWLLEAKGK